MERCEGSRNTITLLNKDMEGIKLLRIRQHIKSGEKHIDKQNEKIKKVMRKHYDDDVIWIVQEKLTKELELPNLSFDARKHELLANKQAVFRYLQTQTEPGRGRSTFMLVLDSLAWSENELTELIWEIKNYYADILMIVKKTNVNVVRMAEFLYDECGLVIHIMSDVAAVEERVDAALFLLEQWDDSVTLYSFVSGYVVAEWEDGMPRQRKNFRKRSSVKRKELYAGFVYEKNKRQFPYEMAVALLNCHDKKGDQFQISQDSPISIVAINSVTML